MRFVLIACVALALLACTSTITQAKNHGASGSLFSMLPTGKINPIELEAELAQRLQHLTAGDDKEQVDANKTKGTKDCLICVLIVSLVEQYAWDANLSLSSAVTNWCSEVTVELPLLTGVCDLVFGGGVATIQNDFNNKVSPDVTCRSTLMKCNDAPASCALFPTWPPPPHKEAPRVGMDHGLELKHTHRFQADVASRFLNVHHVTEAVLNTRIDELIASGMASDKVKEFVAATGNKGDWIPVPIPDNDKDKYGSTWTYRGIQYRGKDCNDGDATVYPGKNALQGDFDASEDSNCNGIYGLVNPAAEASETFEQAFCSQTPPRGMMSIGDSATAHFSLPPSFLTPSGFNMSTYSRIIQDALTELDWPQCSWSTAWGNSTMCPYSKLNVSSIYQRMLDRNRCMFRDYVNAGVNGASVDNIIPDGPIVPSNYTGAMQAIPSRYKVDGPSTVFFSMVGNDICHAHFWDDYTPVATFQSKATEIFQYLDTVLAPKSHVIIMGLVDGRVLYDTLKDAIHPIGAPYPAFYDYLNCLKTSPCWGWMQTNQTIRDESTRFAFAYNQVYGEIIANNTYNNFDLHYFFPDFAGIVANWTAAGNNPHDLIEPVDGFHPSQTGNMLLAANYWDWLVQNVPDALGEINPFNENIIEQFGNQGGYGY